VTQYLTSALVNVFANEGVTGKTIGIVGVGNIGSRVERVAEILGMEVLLNDPPRERAEGSADFEDLYTLLGNSDLVTMHVPLNLSGPDQTLRMAGQEFFGRMKSGSYFINTSRGDVLDETALLESLDRKKIQGAVLDVWKDEPDINRELLEKVWFGTPHIAGYSMEGKANATDQVVRAMADHFGLRMDKTKTAKSQLVYEDTITLDGSVSSWRSLLEAINSSYHIEKDSRRLKTEPYRFEEFRDHYPPRHEFTAYTVSGNRLDDNLIATLGSLGFKLKHGTEE
jgi:erythronate-4-phosphate dehydrogenase